MSGSQPLSRQIGIAMAYTAAVLMAVVLIQIAMGDAIRYDFSTRYAAGYMIAHGESSRLYDVAEQISVQQRLFHISRPMLIMIPPFESLLYAPLARLSYNSAYVVWALFNIALWMAFAYAMRPRAAAPQRMFQHLILCFAFFPLWITLCQGQTTLLVLLGFGLCYLRLKSGHDFQGGLALGLGLFKYPLALPLLLIFLLRRKWRLAGGFILTGLALAAIGLAAVGWGGAVSYVRLMLDTIAHPGNPAYWAIQTSDMPSVRGVFSSLLGGRIGAGWIAGLIGVASAILILWAARPWRERESRQPDDLAFASAVIISLLTAPYMNPHDLSVLLLPVLLAIYSPRWPRGMRNGLLLKASMALIYIPFLYPVLVAWKRLDLLALVLAVFLVGIYGLLHESGSPAPDALDSEAATRIDLEHYT